MRRFVEGVDRGQTTLFPECQEDWIGEDNPVATAPRKKAPSATSKPDETYDNIKIPGDSR